MNKHSLDHLAQTAINAFHGVSFSPEKRGKSTITEFTDELNEDIAQIELTAAKFETDSFAAISRYKLMYEKYLSRWLHSQSNCMSSFITGPSNFPVRSQQKRHQWADNRFSEFREWRRRVLNKICKSFEPAVTPLTELEKAKKDLAERIEYQHIMKKVNKTHAAFLKNPAVLESSDLSESQKQKIKNYQPKYSYEKSPYRTWELSNNNQNIARLKKRIIELEQKAAKHVKGEQREIIINGVRIVDNYEADRMQIFFDGKPAQNIIDNLKSHGWRWSPINKCWQRKLTGVARHNAIQIVS